MVTTQSEVFLYMHGKHTPESHARDQVARRLKLQQKEAVQSVVRVHPMASAADVTAMSAKASILWKNRVEMKCISPFQEERCTAGSGQGAAPAPPGAR